MRIRGEKRQAYQSLALPLYRGNSVTRDIKLSVTNASPTDEHWRELSRPAALLGLVGILTNIMMLILCNILFVIEYRVDFLVHILKTDA